MQSKTTQVKSGFGSKLGFILAAAGSAVGLGNIWRFPYLAAKYGGGMFLLVYLIFAVTFGFALMATEIAIGRRTGKSVIQAYSDMNCHFKPLGWLAGAIPVIILPYYCVIGGWVLKYLVIFTTGSGASAAGDGSYFSNFIGHAGSPMLFFAIFILLTAVVVMLGVQKGVEKVSKLMMPVLLILIVGISIYTLTLPGAIDGLIYYVKPDFNQFSIKTVIAAVGQLFYSMSLAMGIMITYGSYMRKEDNIESSVRQIEVFDTLVAFLSGLIIVPAVFVFSGGDENALATADVFTGLTKFYEVLKIKETKDALTTTTTTAPANNITTTTTTSTSQAAVAKIKAPKKTSIKKVKGAKKAISVTWKKVSGVKGYQVQVATDKKFKKNKKTVKIKKQKTTKVTIKKLKAKKKYYVRVRTYKIVNGKKVYSSWSKVKSVKTK